MGDQRTATYTAVHSLILAFVKATKSGDSELRHQATSMHTASLPLSLATLFSSPAAHVEATITPPVWGMRWA